MQKSSTEHTGWKLLRHCLLLSYRCTSVSRSENKLDPESSSARRVRDDISNCIHRRMNSSCRLPKKEGEDHRKEKPDNHAIEKIPNNPAEHEYAQHYEDTELTTYVNREMYPHDENPTPHDIEDYLLSHILCAKLIMIPLLPSTPLPTVCGMHLLNS